MKILCCPEDLRYFVDGTEYIAFLSKVSTGLLLFVKQGTKQVATWECKSPEDVNTFLRTLLNKKFAGQIEELYIGTDTWWKDTENGWEPHHIKYELGPEFNKEMLLGSKTQPGKTYTVKAKPAFNLYEHKFYVHRSVEDTGFVVSELTTGTAVQKRTHPTPDRASKEARKTLLFMGRDSVQKALKKHDIINDPC